jgi:SprT-like family
MKTDVKDRSTDILAALKEAFAFFNQTLFDGRLPEVTLILERRSDARGFFRPGQVEEWDLFSPDVPDDFDGGCIEDAADKMDELFALTELGNALLPEREPKHIIGLDPERLAEQDDEQNLAVLVHEMVHLWQELYGKRSGCHDRQWRAKMRELGLPSFVSPHQSEEQKRLRVFVAEAIQRDGPYYKAYRKLRNRGFKLGVPE